MNLLVVHERPTRVRRAATGAIGVVLFAGCIALAAWLMYRPLARGHGPDYQGRPDVRAARAAAAVTPLGLRVVGPAIAGDSSAAAAYAVHVADANTPAGAILWLRQMGADVPAGTYVAVQAESAGEYRVLAGAYPDSAAAGALLQRLRAHGQLSEWGGTVVRFPLAYLIERGVSANAVAARVAAYAARGLPVYALRQADGRARLYAGAFATASDTTPTAGMLRRAGIHATLAYRTGRPF
jgi:SPOR domain